MPSIYRFITFLSSDPNWTFKADVITCTTTIVQINYGEKMFNPTEWCKQQQQHQQQDIALFFKIIHSYLISIKDMWG